MKSFQEEIPPSPGTYKLINQTNQISEISYLDAFELYYVTYHKKLSGLRAQFTHWDILKRGERFS